MPFLIPGRRHERPTLFFFLVQAIPGFSLNLLWGKVVVLPYIISSPPYPLKNPSYGGFFKG